MSGQRKLKNVFEVPRDHPGLRGFLDYLYRTNHVNHDHPLQLASQFYGELGDVQTFIDELPFLPHVFYNWVGPRVTRSLFFAIDPFADLRDNYGIIAPISRTKVFSYPGGSTTRNVWRNSIVRNKATTPNSDPPETTARTVTSTDTNTGSMGVRRSIRQDTSYATRKPEEKFGEADFFRIHLHNSSRSIAFTRADDIVLVDVLKVGGGHDTQYTIRRDTRGMSTGRYGASLSRSDFSSIETTERNRANSLLGSQALPLYEAARPFKRSFNAFRELVELRDLPQTLHGTVTMVRDRVKTLESASRKLSKDYLNNVFGWGPILKSVEDMMTMPEKISKRINYLLKRQGLITTFRSKKQFLDTGIVPIAFDWVSSTDENFTSTEDSRSASREIELNCSLSARFEFPPISVPRIKSQLSDQFFGSNPHPIDVYNLIPWTWLVDWFSGMGDYLNMIEVVHTSNDIVNYGFLSYKSMMRYRHYRKFKVTESVTRPTDLQGHTSTTSTQKVNVGNAGLDAILYKRIDLSKSLTLTTPMRSADFFTV